MLLTCISDPSEEHAEIGTEKCRKKYGASNNRV